MLWIKDVKPSLVSIAIGLSLVVVLLMTFRIVFTLLDTKAVKDISEFMNSYETERVLAGY